MDSNALMTRKRQKICCDLLALVKSWHKKLCHFYVYNLFLSVDYNAVSLPMQSFQWDSNNGS